MSDNTTHTPSSPYTMICGMEVHAELKTNSKMFCGCKNDPFFAEKPNIYTCPVCLGLPGALPVMNKTAIEWTIKLGLALNCKINLFSKFDRKHYFYPDLPKGYQISQYDLPFCYGGVLETEFGPVRIRRIHLEEDTAKLVHKEVNGKKVSLIDFNRSSVPLVEIVTEPDIHSPEHAKAYGKALRQILRFLDIADCDMEQGGMRLEANVSILKTNGKPVNVDKDKLPDYKVELKNINSFRFMEKAIQYELKRQAKALEEGEQLFQETRGWNEAKGETFSQRTKEDAEDYRYFPDPDLPPLRFTEQFVEDLRKTIPELPVEITARWKKEFSVEERNAEILIDDQKSAAWAEQLFTAAQAEKLSPNAVANSIVNKKIAAQVGDDVQKIISAFNQANQTDAVDPAELQKAIQAVIAENADAVEQYKKGKTQVVGFFMGQVQKKLGKKLNPQDVIAEVKKELEK
jgi:aspartyl-tRNA(Asn)/glutamyl-tRNA(Gln) amidotransferase subunit B